MSYDSYGKYQLSLKKGDIMINVSAVDREEFIQRVKDAKWVLETEFAPPAPVKDEIPFHGGRTDIPTPPPDQVGCKYCGGPTWDNRTSKKGPRHPDYKCRNKNCGAAAWIGKTGDLSWRTGQL